MAESAHRGRGMGVPQGKGGVSAQLVKARPGSFNPMARIKIPI